MNWLQKVVLMVGGVLMLANLTYPPWVSDNIEEGGGPILRLQADQRAWIWDHPPCPPCVVSLEGKPLLDWDAIAVFSFGMFMLTAAAYFGTRGVLKSQNSN
jgi:hypothetical protein